MKHIYRKLACLILMPIWMVGGCALVPSQGELNTTADGGQGATACDAEGEVAMLAAAMVIDEGNSVQCDRTEATFKTAVLGQDSYHALAAICTGKLFAELYYSTDRAALDRLPGLASTAAGANFDLPVGVGLLVESRTISPAQRFEDAAVYIQPGRAYSPNRLEYRATLPGFIADFSRPGVSPAQFPLSAGRTVYYKWAKRVEKEGEGDPMRFSSDTYSFTHQPPNGVDAGPDQTITAPEQDSASLTATIVDSYRTLRQDSISWRWKQQNFGPSEPTIVNPASPITDVVFDDHGNHLFEFRASDRCGRTFLDEVVVRVNGTFASASGRQVIVQSGATCEATGRQMSARNTADDRMRVTIRERRDFRSWFDESTPGARQITTVEYRREIGPNEAIPLGCSVVRGSDLNGSDIGFVSYSIVSEQQL